MIISAAKNSYYFVRSVVYNVASSTLLCAASAGISAGCCYIGRQVFRITTPVNSAAQIGGISMLALIALSMFASFLRYWTTFDKTDTTLLTVLGTLRISTLLQPYIRGLSFTSSIAFSIIGIVPVTALLAKKRS